MMDVAILAPTAESLEAALTWADRNYPEFEITLLDFYSTSKLPDVDVVIFSGDKRRLEIGPLKRFCIFIHLDREIQTRETALWLKKKGHVVIWRRNVSI